VAVLNRTLDRSEPKPATSLRLGPVLLIAGLAIVIIALLQIVQTSEATTTGFSIQSLKQEKLELESAVRGVEAEVAALSSIERVEREAARLGLAPATSRRTRRKKSRRTAHPGGENSWNRFRSTRANRLAGGRGWRDA